MLFVQIVDSSVQFLNEVIFGGFMIIAYTLKGQSFVGKKLENVTTNTSLPDGVMWFDLLNPTVEEERRIENKFNVNIPTKKEIEIIEVMSPFYKERDVYYMTITAVNQSSSEYLESSALTLILTNTCIITVRHAQMKQMNNAVNFIQKKFSNMDLSLVTPDILFLFVVEVLINHIAIIMEKTGNNLDKLLSYVFDSKIDKEKIISSEYYNDIMSQIGNVGNIISKNKESLMTINRLVIYYAQITENYAANKKEVRNHVKQMAREVYSLNEYANFLSQRNGFLLDATLGVLSVEQNMIIKVFTVAAAVFMPPTLIASIYGMNFRFIPELNWSFGYPLALLLILGSAILPYFFFKRKKWL